MIFRSSLDKCIPTKIIFLLREFLHRRKNSFDKDRFMLHPLHHRTIISLEFRILGHQKHPRRQEYPIDENESIVYIEKEICRLSFKTKSFFRLFSTTRKSSLCFDCCPQDFGEFAFLRMKRKEKSYKYKHLCSINLTPFVLISRIVH